MLSDRDIIAAWDRAELSIFPFNWHRVQAASYDVALHAVLLVPSVYNYREEPADPARSIFPEYRKVEMTEQYGFLMQPGGFILGSTAERLELSSSLAARVEGRSSLARLGLAVHVTAGFIDPGFRGHITLELKNLGPRSILLRPGLQVAQLAFDRLEQRAANPYQGVFQNQTTDRGLAS